MVAGSTQNASGENEIHAEHTGGEWQQLTSQTRLYLMSAFCKFSLPYTEPTDITFWKRRNGQYDYIVTPSFRITAQDEVKPVWLYGKIGRLLLIWLSTQVKLHKVGEDRTVALPHSLNQLMSELGIQRQDGKPNSKEYKKFREQVTALAELKLSVVKPTDTATTTDREGEPQTISVKYKIGWEKHEKAALNNESYVTLSKETYETMQHSTPLDAAAVMLLTTVNQSNLMIKSHSHGQDLDLYCWLNARNYTLTHSGTWQTAPITWQQLAEQFGNTYKEQKEFVRKFKRSLANVCVVWPDLNVEIIDGQGIVLHRTKRSVTPKPQPTGM